MPAKGSHGAQPPSPWALREAQGPRPGVRDPPKDGDRTMGAPDPGQETPLPVSAGSPLSKKKRNIHIYIYI